MRGGGVVVVLSARFDLVVSADYGMEADGAWIHSHKSRIGRGVPRRPASGVLMATHAIY